MGRDLAGSPEADDESRGHSAAVDAALLAFATHLRLDPDARPTEEFWPLQNCPNNQDACKEMQQSVGAPLAWAWLAAATSRKDGGKLIMRTSTSCLFSIGCCHACYEQHHFQMDSNFREKQVSCLSVQRNVPWVSHWPGFLTSVDQQIWLAICLLCIWIPWRRLVCTVAKQSTQLSR